MIRYSATHRDENQAEIVKALKQIGCDVLDLSAVGGGCPDILVCRSGVLYLIEIKNPKKKGKLRGPQEKWHQEWRGSVFIANSIEEAIKIVCPNAR